jgi:ATP-binding cassette subfamily B protein
VRRAWKTFRRVLPYLRPYRTLAVLSIIFTFLTAGFSLLLPWPLALTFDSVLGDEPLPAVLPDFLSSVDRFTLLVLLALAGLGITAGEGILKVLNKYVSTKLDQRMVMDLRSDMFQHAQRLSLAFHDQRRTGVFAAQITLQAPGAGAIVKSIPPLLQAFVTLVGMVVIAFTIDPVLTLLAISVIPFIYYSTGYYAKRIEPRLVQVRGMEGESLSIISEAMAMIRLVIPFCREPYEHRRFLDQGERTVDARVSLTVRQTLYSTGINVITAIGTALVLGFGAYRILQGHLSAGDLLVMMTYVAKVYEPLQQMSITFTSLQEQFVRLRGALQLLDNTPEVEDAPGAYEIGRALGDVSFEGVHFSYPGRVDTLKDISFEARAGTHLAIVGPTGAGKSTLMNLLTRFSDPSQGRILLDGVDIRELTLRSLREQISTVLQEPLLFSGSIADNIRYGRLEASMEDIMEAAKAANAHDFIMRLPNKYDTKLGERGSQLSGGERQRISIARAFLKDAPILILDEPTSSIDSKTEAVILDSLERLAAGRTTLTIAHRLSTIRNADLILVLNHGRLVERGTHEDLLEHGGLYQRLYVTQAGGAQEKASFALLTASPNPIPAGDGPGTTTISWDTGDGSPGQVYVSVDGAEEKLFAGGADGSREVGWIQPSKEYEFRLYAGTEQAVLLDAVTVCHEERQDVA